MPFLIKKFISTTVPILLTGFLFASAVTGDEEPNQPEPQALDGLPVVVIDKNTQTASGLKTMAALSDQNLSEYQATGKVVSIEPLLALKQRFLVAQAELKGAKARLKQTGESLGRQQNLFRNGVAAKRSLQEQQNQVSADQATVDAAEVRLTAIAHETRLLWGDLAEWILSGQPDKLAAFLSGKQFLLQIILPSNKKLERNISTIVVEANGDRSKASPAMLIARSIQTDNSISGESFFFKTAAANLRIGMKLQAWIPEQTDARAGVVVPEQTLLWYMDQAFVYIKTGEEGFYRRKINQFSATTGGYFIPDDINPGEKIVVTGGQMLLSEELRGQIPDED